MAGKQKLKVFRTPIGFHDAYVAAPSQKAALEAWGSDTNLFARGAAEQVTDPELIKEPLENPGVVLKRLRGSEKEQIAALGEQEAKQARARAERARAEAAKPKPRPAKPKRPPRPSRAKLDEAEEALAEAERRQRKELNDVDAELEALERRRRELQRRHERERDELAEAAERERAAYDRAMRKWAGA